MELHELSGTTDANADIAVNMDANNYILSPIVTSPANLGYYVIPWIYNDMYHFNICKKANNAKVTNTAITVRFYTPN